MPESSRQREAGLVPPQVPSLPRRSPATPPLEDAVSGRRKATEKVDAERADMSSSTGGENPLSSVVFFGEVQRSQASETEAAALRVKAVHFSVLTLKQVLDPLRALLLQRRQLLFDLSGENKQTRVGRHTFILTPFIRLALANASCF